MEKRALGKTGPSVSAIGLGCMRMSGTYGSAERAESIATLHAALDAGVTLIDTGDFYGRGHNEALIGEALQGVPRDSYQLSVKFGAMWHPDGRWVGNDSRPKAIQNFLSYSLQRLGVDYIDIYRPSRLDVDVPIEETMGALAELVDAGFIRHIGLSEIGSATLRRAAAVHPVTDVQIEYSLIARGLEDNILATARELGVAITAYGVLASGLISGHWQKDAADPKDMRNSAPRFQGENLAANLQLVETLRALATAKGASVAQMAIAWVLHQGPDIIAIVGSRRRDQLNEALGSLEVKLTSADLARIEQAFPKGVAAGDRLSAAQLAILDSETEAG